jgi:hypothetical protein
VIFGLGWGVQIRLGPRRFFTDPKELERLLLLFYFACSPSRTSDPLVRHATVAKPGREGQAKIVDPKDPRSAMQQTQCVLSVVSTSRVAVICEPQSVCGSRPGRPRRATITVNGVRCRIDLPRNLGSNGLASFAAPQKRRSILKSPAHSAERTDMICRKER